MLCQGCGDPTTTGSGRIHRICVGASPDTPPGADFVLCHGDVTPDHIFLDSDLRVSGLIDWGMWHGGSRVGELAYVASWAFAEADLAALLEGYDSSMGGRSLWRAIALSLVNQLVGHIAHHVSIGDIDGTASVTEVLRRALAELSPEVDSKPASE